MELKAVSLRVSMFAKKNLLLNLNLFLLVCLMSCHKEPIASEVIKNSLNNIAGKPVHIRIFKEENLLEVWIKGNEKFELFKIYEICNWSGSLGPKLKEGDGQSPEGFYIVNKELLKPDSRYHRAFNIGFPNEFDRQNGRTGSFIMVHGDCVSIGCYAMTDPFIEEIYYLVDQALNNSQSEFSVHIFPFKMTYENLNKNKEHKWYEFWLNLKEGYDLFEKEHIPPSWKAVDKKYVFELP